jgi:hypothetical protein
LWFTHLGAGGYQRVGLTKAADGDGARWHAIANPLTGKRLRTSQQEAHVAGVTGRFGQDWTLSSLP